METFSSNPPKDFPEEGKWLLTVTSFEATNSVLFKLMKTIVFQVLNLDSGGFPTITDGIIDRLKELLELLSQNDIEIHVREFKKRDTRRKKENSGFNVAWLHHFKNEILVELRRVKYHDPEDILYRKELTYDEFMEVLDIKYSNVTSIRYTLPHGIYKISDINFLLKSLLSSVVKVNITNDDFRLKSNLTTNKTIRFTEKSFFFYHIRSYSTSLRSFR